MKASATFFDEHNVEHGGYVQDDMTVTLDGGVIKIDIGSLTPEPNVLFVGTTVEIDLVSAERLHEILGDILYVLPEEERAENI